MTEKKKRKSKGEARLEKAINALASIIELKSSAMLEKMEEDTSVEIKQIKELTGAVKELSALIYQNEGGTQDTGSYTVIFQGEGEEWAK